MTNSFHKIIKAVGTGPKHNHDLTQEEMKNAMCDILSKKVYNEQISAFLLGWRLKPETTDEFKGALDGFDEFIKKTTIENSVEVGYPYDGRVNNPHLFVLVAKFVAQFNLNIVVSGDKIQPAKNGVTVKDICSNYPNIDEVKNLHFFNREDFLTELSSLTEVRQRLGLRTGLNSIERLLNPANSKIALLGVFHKPFVQKYADVFSNRYEKFVIVKGDEGTPEIFSKSKYWIVQNNEMTEYSIDPAEFGINYVKPSEPLSLEKSLEAIKNPDEELTKIAKLNAAMILFTYGKVNSIKEGYEKLTQY